MVPRAGPDSARYGTRVLYKHSVTWRQGFIAPHARQHNKTWQNSIVATNVQVLPFSLRGHGHGHSRSTFKRTVLVRTGQLEIAPGDDSRAMMPTLQADGATPLFDEAQQAALKQASRSCLPAFSWLVHVAEPLLLQESVRRQATPCSVFLSPFFCSHWGKLSQVKIFPRCQQNTEIVFSHSQERRAAVGGETG